MVKLSELNQTGVRTVDAQRTASALTSFAGIEFDVFVTLNRSFDVQC